MNINNHVPGKELYLKVRAGFITQGTTLTGWCRSNNVHPTNAKSSLIGSWNGPKGRELRTKLIAESSMPTSSTALNQ